MHEFSNSIGCLFLIELHSCSENAKYAFKFQTKMEELSVEVYGENGAYYKVCKLWSTIELYIKRVIFISDLYIQLYRAIVFEFCHILTKIFFREDHRGWNGRHVRLTGREFSMCFIVIVFLRSQTWSWSRNKLRGKLFRRHLLRSLSQKNIIMYRITKLLDHLL